MRGVFLKENAADLIAESNAEIESINHALNVVEHGYTVVRNGVSDELCRRCIAEFKRLESRNPEIFAKNRTPDGHYPRMVNLHVAIPALLELFTNNRIWLQTQDILFGAETALYTSLFYEVGSQQPLHRDTPYFATRPEYLFFGTTVYLEDSDEGNGCLEVLEGGHKIPELNREAMALAKYATLDDVPTSDDDLWNAYQSGVEQKAVELGLKRKKIQMKTGDCLIWHPQLPHGGTIIKDKARTRFSLVMHTTPVGVPVYHQNVFFNPRKAFDETAGWNYRSVDGRKVAEISNSISFGHVDTYALSELNL